MATVVSMLNSEIVNFPPTQSGVTNQIL